MNPSLKTSVRRYFVDEFFAAQSARLENRRIIDIGGKRAHKRGVFRVEALSKDVTYVNIDADTAPDIVAPAEHIPLPGESFEVAMMGELLEHVPDPRQVLNEAHRLLTRGGVAIGTVPFLFPIHADPYDFGRYTDVFLKKALTEAGFSRTEVSAQGAFFAVLALMVQHFFLSRRKSWRPVQIPLVRFLMWLDGKTRNKALQSWTTGFGFVAIK